VEDIIAERKRVKELSARPRPALPLYSFEPAGALGVSSAPATSGASLVERRCAVVAVRAPKRPPRASVKRRCASAAVAHCAQKCRVP